MGNFFTGDSKFQEWYKQKQLEKYGSYFGGSNPPRTRTDSGSSVGTQGNTEPYIPRDEKLPQDKNQRYWAAQRVGDNSTAAQFTNSLNRMDRSRIPSSGGGDAAAALGVQSNTRGQTATNTNQSKSGSLYFGSNEGPLPTLTFGSQAPQGFYDDPPDWVNNREEYQITLDRIGTVKRRPDKEVTESSEDDKAIQEALTAAGYDPGPIDGFWGAKTDAALSQFKSDNGMQANPELDSFARRALQSTVSEVADWAGKQK